MSGTLAYQQQLHDKIRHIERLFADLQTPALEIFDSPAEHYRMRAEFRVWHQADEIFYAMFDRGQKASTATLQRIERLPAACTSINQLMPRLLSAAAANPVLRHRWYQVEFLATLSGDMLVTMIYHRKLDAGWEAAARALQDRLGIHVIGRSKGQKIVLTQDFVTERLSVDYGDGTGTGTGNDDDLEPAPSQHLGFVYRQPEGAFTQPNARVCEKMISWACQAAEGLGGDLLELYCGNGNFSLPLARRFRRVLATEISKTSVHAAQWNIEANHCPNLRIARLSAEEFTQAWQGQRSFRRLQQAGITLTDYDFTTILVDPPRAGIDDQSLTLVQQFDNIIYISCNPDTLHDNLRTLSRTHTITRFALFDQFPFTHHIECGVVLRRGKTSTVAPRKNQNTKPLSS
ncbi:MAG: tRNA (uridine(54)-C5)-methyltransferase TrmA [Lautropia sp.]|nr:tRNA (uridine(54)-C5)-methyltransferase TrmA [Lautropia sp.]